MYRHRNEEASWSHHGWLIVRDTHGTEGKMWYYVFHGNGKHVSHLAPTLARAKEWIEQQGVSITNGDGTNE